jgi:hypothetical protein
MNLHLHLHISPPFHSFELRHQLSSISAKSEYRSYFHPQTIIIMADAGADFAGYMEDLARAEAEQEATRELLKNHEIWRHTTLGGWAVRKMQALARNLEPFLTKIAHAFRDTDSASSVIVVNLIRFVAIFVLMFLIYFATQILQKIIGNELVVEEEVVILHEYETEEEAAKARAKITRSKKDRSKKD